MTVESNSLLQCGTLCLSTGNFSIYQNDALKNVNLGKNSYLGPISRRCSKCQNKILSLEYKGYIEDDNSTKTNNLTRKDDSDHMQKVRLQKGFFCSSNLER